jgi:hypothetical protein
VILDEDNNSDIKEVESIVEDTEKFLVRLSNNPKLDEKERHIML